MPYKDPTKRKEVVRKSVAKLRKRIRRVKHMGISGDVLVSVIGAQMNSIIDGKKPAPFYLRIFRFRNETFIMPVSKPDEPFEKEFAENIEEANAEGFNVDSSKSGIKSLLEGLTWEPFVFKLEITGVKENDSGA